MGNAIGLTNLVPRRWIERMTAIPELVTDRLRLRAFTREDFDWYCAMWQDPEVLRFIGGEARDQRECWMRFLMNFGMWDIERFGFWLVEDRADGTRLGSGGLLAAIRGIAEIDAHPEAGWAFLPVAYGRGVATETMTAVLAWADAQVDAPQTGCIIEPDNVASIRVAEKLDYRATGSATFQGDAIGTYVRMRGGA